MAVNLKIVEGAVIQVNHIQHPKIKKVDGKKFENVDCKCNKKFIEQIPEASRKQLFETFWN